MSNYHEGKLVYPEYSHIANRNYIVDMVEIVKQKHKIPMQYEDINIGGNSDDLHYLSKKVDRYLLHIIEEIAEFKEEVDKLNLDKKLTYIKMTEDNHKEALMELIDVAAYISSLLSILCIDMYGLEKVANGKFECEEDFKIDSYELTGCCLEYPVIDIINGFLMEVEKILMLDIRRQFPERKWHKDVDRILSISELDEMYSKLIYDTSSALVGIIGLFMYLTDWDYNLFNKLFLEKNEIVYNLKG